VAGTHVIEHGGTAASRWLQERRLKLALGIAVVEGVLVVAHVIPKWVAIVVGVAVVAYWYFVGRNHSWQLARQVSWTAALSQVFMALVPLLLFVFTALAVAVLVIIAAVALIALLADRR
jgi:mannose/fructose/N-acetylgalactosamine-specific phosphotransferase system component IID